MPEIELLLSVIAVLFLWGLYSLLVRYAPAFFLGCVEAGMRRPRRSLFYGAGLFLSALAAIYMGLLLARSGGGAHIGRGHMMFRLVGLGFSTIFLVFPLAGLGIGLVSINGMLGLIDPAKRPYHSLALGLGMLLASRIFSPFYSNLLCLLAGIYGVGALLVWFNGETRPAAGKAPATERKPAEAPPAAGAPAPAGQITAPGDSVPGNEPAGPDNK